MENEDKMYAEMPITVHSYDVDFMNIVNNTVYVKWLEDLRMAILDKYLPLTDMLKEGNSPILMETTIQYKRPVSFDSHPVGKCWIWMVSKGRWVAEHVIEEDGKVYATARQTGYYYNIERKRPVSFPEAILEKYMEK